MLTYCPHCGTAFRVNEAHLQARRGRVRCGRCNGIFNALENLVASHPPASEPSAGTTQPLSSPARSASAPQPVPEARARRTTDSPAPKTITSHQAEAAVQQPAAPGSSTTATGEPRKEIPASSPAVPARPEKIEKALSRIREQLETQAVVVPPETEVKEEDDQLSPTDFGGKTAATAPEPVPSEHPLPAAVQEEKPAPVEEPQVAAEHLRLDEIATRIAEAETAEAAEEAAADEASQISQTGQSDEGDHAAILKNFSGQLQIVESNVQPDAYFALNAPLPKPAPAPIPAPQEPPPLFFPPDQTAGSDWPEVDVKRSDGDNSADSPENQAAHQEEFWPDIKMPDTEAIEITAFDEADPTQPPAAVPSKRKKPEDSEESEAVHPEPAVAGSDFADGPPPTKSKSRSRQKSGKTGASSSATVESYFSMVPADEITVTFNDSISFPPLRPNPSPHSPGEEKSLSSDDSTFGESRWLEAPSRKSKKRKISLRQGAFLFVLILVLLFALLIQAAIHYRNELALDYPASKPTLALLCAPFGCTIAPMQNEKLIHTEVSNLKIDPAHGNLFLFTATLTNQASQNQAWPFIELTLTDSLEDVVARKIFRPADYLAEPHEPLFPALNDFYVSLWMDIKDIDAANYRIDVFYP